MSSMVGSFFFPGSFNPPVLPAPAATRADSPAWVILDQVAYIGNRTNGTFAQAATPTGQYVGVSFWLTDSPAVSHMCIHCSDVKVTDLVDEPVVLCSGKDIAVIRISYKDRDIPIDTVQDLGIPDSDYLVYRGYTEPPSLEVIPNPKPNLFHPWETGLLPCGNGKDFLMAILRPGDVPLKYMLHVFSSKTKTWTTRSMLLDPPFPWYKDEPLMLHETDKVITLEGGLLGWVDLWHGMLMCNVLDTSPTLQYIQFPGPMGGNMLHYPETRARAIRDATFSDGFIKLIEIEDQKGLGALCGPLNGMGAFTTESHKNDGWTVFMWRRKLSADPWIQGYPFYVDRSSVVNKLSHNHSESSALENLEMAGPIWSMDGGDVVHLMAKATSNDNKNAWAISVDMRKNTLEGAIRIPAERDNFFMLAYHPFAISKYADMDSVNCKGTTLNSGKWLTVLVKRLDPRVTFNQLKGITEIFGEVRSLKIQEEEQCGLVQFVSRKCAEQAIKALNGALIGSLCVHLSWKPSDRNSQEYSFA
ncbi:hypothetical protein EJB05_07421 [Eragrostis curvula]|uniref:RRM domain-containing protein n=1 Tax=Eragrostis curvula TaxID=38414 RepID=A0A5J9WGJ9_9POAL|nr:hypothetical protein EJB05_07421 [Eragrostis curvula]